MQCFRLLDSQNLLSSTCVPTIKAKLWEEQSTKTTNPTEQFFSTDIFSLNVELFCTGNEYSVPIMCKKYLDYVKNFRFFREGFCSMEPVN